MCEFLFENLKNENIRYIINVFIFSFFGFIINENAAINIENEGIRIYEERQLKLTG